MTQTRIHTTARLYVQMPLQNAGVIALSREQSHYLAQVMRKREGDMVRVFNGQHGEWQAVILQAGKKEVTLQLQAELRPQGVEPDIRLVFAPLKNEAMHFLIEKSTELGVKSFQPVLTDRTVVQRVNSDKIAAAVMEAAEQCERLTVPELIPLASLAKVLAEWPHERLLLLADEMDAGNPVHKVLIGVKASFTGHASWGVLVGPEGGFTDAERAMLRALPFVVPIGLGPRILRADTAAVAALTCLQSVLGDWEISPRFHFE